MKDLVKHMEVIKQREERENRLARRKPRKRSVPDDVVRHIRKEYETKGPTILAMELKIPYANIRSIGKGKTYTDVV